MSLEITRREREGNHILDLKGRIVVGDEALALPGRPSTSLPDRRRRGLLLNMQEVDYVDSTGLGAIVMCATRAKIAEWRGQARQCQPPPASNFWS